MDGMSGIHDEVMSMISNMSAEEMQETLQSFLSSMQNPDTLQLLQKRIARSSGSEVQQNQELSVKESSLPVQNDSLESVSDPLKEIDDDEREARRIANEIDYSTILSEADLAAAVQKLPLSERRKLEWTTPAQTSSSSSSKSSEPRFHFDGYLLSSSESSQIDVYSGLYNHGADADLPGYTLSELLLLSRSNVHGQRILALKCIFNLLRRRSFARIAHQSLTPAELPVELVRTLVLLLERRETGEEVFLALRCLEELGSTQEEFRRFLLLNLSYHGYEHADLQDPTALRFVSDEKEEEEDEEDDDDRANQKDGGKENHDPFCRKNCGSLFTMLDQCDLLSTLFACLADYRDIPAVVNPLLSVLRVLVENDKRFSERLLRSDSFYSSIETLGSQVLNPSILPASPLRPQPTAPTASSSSLRLFYFENHAQTAFCTSLHFLLLLEALVRHSRENATHLFHSSLLPALKQWLLFFDGSYNASLHNCELNAVLEGVLSVWRLFLMYGIDVESVDPFLPHLLRICQFALPPAQSLVWSFFEVSVLSKRTVSSEYFVDFCNTLVQLVIELHQRSATPSIVRAAATHFIASYVEAVNEARETWEASEELMDSLQNQILQLGYILLHTESEEKNTTINETPSVNETPSINNETPSINNETPSSSSVSPFDELFASQRSVESEWRERSNQPNVPVRPSLSLPVHHLSLGALSPASHRPASALLPRRAALSPLLRRGLRRDPPRLPRHSELPFLRVAAPLPSLDLSSPPFRHAPRLDRSSLPALRRPHLSPSPARSRPGHRRAFSPRRALSRRTGIRLARSGVARWMVDGASAASRR